MNDKIQFTAELSADIPEEIRKERNIATVGLQVHLEDKEYKDGPLCSPPGLTTAGWLKAPTPKGRRDSSCPVPLLRPSPHGAPPEAEPPSGLTHP